MSSSSEPARIPTTDHLADDRVWTVRLLRAMAREWASLAANIAELGASLSAHAGTSPGAPLVRDMQAFDVLSQRALAQFRVLERACNELSEPRVGTGIALDYIIGDLPFNDMRQMLIAALNGQEAAGYQEAPPTEDEDSVQWFE